MKLLFIAFALTFLHCTEARKFDHVRKYLAEHGKSPKPTFKRDVPVGLKNSNTIGLGYNPLYGSPVCYTGVCQGDGFRQSVIKLNYDQPATGSCTSELVPNFVELQCIPSADLQAATETISTLKQLDESTSKGISFGADGKYKIFSAGYNYSKEIGSMIDQMVKLNATIMFTRGQVTFGKLRMFEPFMKLSDPFHYVIEQMPCCDDDNSLETDEYIHEFLIDYFGLTFVTELILGGIAQETIFIGNKEMREMQSKGEDVSHSASVGFFLTFNMKPTSSYNITQQDQFMKSVKTRRSTKLGGDPSAQTMEDWIKSVPENPVIVNYAVKDILTLLTPKHFPNDSHIQNKSKFVQMAIQRYLDSQQSICLNNCTDSNHGECNVSSTAPFLLGTCECRSGWKGNDCSEKEVTIIATTETTSTTKQRKSYRANGNKNVENRYTERLLSFKCPNSEKTDVTQIYVRSTKLDSFYVRTGDGCSPNALVSIASDMVNLSSQGAVNSFLWSNYKPIHNELCVEIECYNNFFSCSVDFDIIVNCE